jgi:hypothetical protein
VLALKTLMVELLRLARCLEPPSALSARVLIARRRAVMRPRRSTTGVAPFTHYH